MKRTHQVAAVLCAAGAIGVVGLIGFFPILKVLLDSRLDQPAILMILAAYLATVFLFFAVLVGHVWKHSGDIRVKVNDRGEDNREPQPFRGVNTAQLDEYREPSMSVTDHTTKTLDKVPLEGN